MNIKGSKIIVFGNSGSGKSTLAKKLKHQNNLAHLDLDTLAWEHNKPVERKPIEQSKMAIDTFTKNHDQWVIEGCYGDLLALVIEDADQVIFMNLTIQQCQENAKNRPWEPHKYPSKEAQDANLDMLLDWIAAYENRQDEFSLSAHEALYNWFSGNKLQIIKNQS